MIFDTLTPDSSTLDAALTFDPLYGTVPRTHCMPRCARDGLPVGRPRQRGPTPGNTGPSIARRCLLALYSAPAATGPAARIRHRAPCPAPLRPRSDGRSRNDVA